MPNYTPASVKKNYLTFCFVFLYYLPEKKKKKVDPFNCFVLLLLIWFVFNIKTLAVFKENEKEKNAESNNNKTNQDSKTTRNVW